METEMTPLNAVVEPMLISASSAATTLVNATAFTGIEVLSLIYNIVSAAHVKTNSCPYLA